jgi:subtilisin family serine protease
MAIEYIMILLITALYYAYYRYKNSKQLTANIIAYKTQAKKVRQVLGVSVFHEKNITGKGIKVGILDTKISEHRELSGVTRLDYEHTGRREGSHGTHVCGIIRNIVPDAEIYSAMAFSGDDHNTSLGVGIKVLVDAGCQVINISIGSDNEYASIRNDVKMPFGDGEKTMQEIYEYLEEEGVIVVLACGNGSSALWGQEFLSDLTQNADDYNYIYGQDVPETSMSSWPVVVTSCKLPDKEELGPMGKYTSGFSEFNTLNKSNNIISYGEDIWSFSNDDNYTEMSGTSMAAPQVTGAIALILSALQDTDDLSKKEIAEKVRDYTLKNCTIRDMYDANQYLPSINDLAGINNSIYYLDLELDEDHKDSDNTEDMNLLKQAIKGFLSQSEVIKNNTQFRSYNVSDLSLYQLLERYVEVSESLEYKYTTLSLGYGILHLRMDESGQYNADEKEPFGYAS